MSAAMDGIVVGHMVTTQSPRETLRETLSESDVLVHRLSRQPTPKSMGSRLTETQTLASPPWVGRRSTTQPLPSLCASQRGSSTISAVSWNLAGSDRATSERPSTSQDAAAYSPSGALASPVLASPTLSSQIAAPAGTDEVDDEIVASIESPTCSLPSAVGAGDAAGAVGTHAALASAEKTFDAHQQTAAARRIIAMCDGTANPTILERLERVRRGSNKSTLLGDLLAAAARRTSASCTRNKADLGGSGAAAACSQACGDAAVTSPGTGTAPPYADRSTSFRNVVAGPHGVDSGAYESYQYEEDESRVHFELRTRLAHNARRQLSILWTSMLFTVLIGSILGVVAGGIIYFETLLVSARTALVDLAFYGGDPCDEAQLPNLRDRSSSTSVATAYVTYVLYNSALILLASTATYFAPAAATSGLPALKAFLNGVNVPRLLASSTLIAKVVGVTLVVSTGLPLGREGPMVHTGAIVAARVTRSKLVLSRKFRYITPIETRVPSAQRTWVGVGCAAGVAAAFNAPLGGILYSFEEVCSHWSAKMTWRSFFCVVVAAIVYNALINAFSNNIANSVLLKSGLVLNLRAPGERPDIQLFEFLALAIVGILGGLLGGIYVTGVVSLNGVRRRTLGHRPRLKVFEATAVAALVFTVLFFFPFAFSCQPCTSGMQVGGVACIPPDPNSTMTPPPTCASFDSSGSGSSAAAPSRRRLGAGASSVSYVQWQCPPHHYNEMASLLHTGQEGLILHLLERRQDTDGSFAALNPSEIDHTFDYEVLLPFLGLYLVIATCVFGIFVPSGNFIPALTIGCGMGRLVGIALNHVGQAADPGFYALMGAAAVLGGVTRMTLTLGVILVEVTDDAAGLLPMMFVLVIAKVVGDICSPSFDHAMMHLLELPFLDEEPPAEFDVLTAVCHANHDASEPCTVTPAPAHSRIHQPAML